MTPVTFYRPDDSMGGCCTKQTERPYLNTTEAQAQVEQWLAAGRPYQALRLYRIAELDNEDLAQRIEASLKNSRGLTE